MAGRPQWAFWHQHCFPCPPLQSPSLHAKFLSWGGLSSMKTEASVTQVWETFTVLRSRRWCLKSLSNLTLGPQKCGRSEPLMVCLLDAPNHSLFHSPPALLMHCAFYNTAVGFFSIKSADGMSLWPLSYSQLKVGEDTVSHVSGVSEERL